MIQSLNELIERCKIRFRSIDLYPCTVDKDGSITWTLITDEDEIINLTSDELIEFVNKLQYSLLVS
jgi:hypothetical protein